MDKILEQQMRPIRQAYTRAWDGLNELYGNFDCLSFDELSEWRKKLDASYKAKFDELRALNLQLQPAA